MPGDQMVFVQVPQNIPESQLLTAQAAGGREAQMFLVLQVFCNSLCLGLANQTDQGDSPHLSYTEGGWNLLGEIFPSPEAGGPACAPPAKTRALPPNSPRATWSQIQHTGYYSPYLNLSHSQMWKEM